MIQDSPENPSPLTQTYPRSLRPLDFIPTSSTSFTMGQVMGKVAVEEEKANEPEGPSFPDYMLDSNAVVSPWF